jgi:hypothetical protein
MNNGDAAEVDERLAEAAVAGAVAQPVPEVSERVFDPTAHSS